jgi:hypothetical protein
MTSSGCHTLLVRVAVLLSLLLAPPKWWFFRAGYEAEIGLFSPPTSSFFKYSFFGVALFLCGALLSSLASAIYYLELRLP